MMLRMDIPWGYNIFLMRWIGIPSNKLWGGSAGYRGIETNARYFPADIPDGVHFSLEDAYYLINSGQVKECDILFPLLMDVIVNDGQVG